MIRRARQDDDLSPFFGEASRASWNRDQILVYDLDGRVVGVVVLWDVGHPIMQVDCLKVLDGQPGFVGASLIKAVLDYAKGHGNALVGFSTPDEGIAEGARKRGAVVRGPCYRVIVCQT